MKQLILSLLVLSCFSCGDQSCIQLTPEDEIMVKHNDELCINGEAYTLVIEDQKCPCDLDCLWAGEFILNFENSEGVNVYAHRQITASADATPPFANSFNVLSDSVEGLCGGSYNLEDVIFTVQVD